MNTIQHSYADTVELFNLVRHQEFPFKLYDVDMTLGSLDNLDELNGLQGYLKNKDSLASHLASFELDEINYAHLYVTTTQEGHKLHAEMRLPDDYEEVVEVVGLDIEKPKWMKKSDWLKWSESRRN